MVRVFVNGLGDWGLIPGLVIPKIQKTVIVASLLNTQNYKVGIKSKVEQSSERSSAISYFGTVAIEKGDLGSPSRTVANFTEMKIS